MNRGFLLLLLFLVLHPAVAAVAATGFDPRQHGDLNPVIVLCATDPGSAEFDQAWMRWVRANPTADLSAAIRTVISRAATLRSMAVPGMAPKPAGERPAPGAVEERMRYLARQARS